MGGSQIFLAKMCIQAHPKAEIPIPSSPLFDSCEGLQSQVELLQPPASSELKIDHYTPFK